MKPIVHTNIIQSYFKNNLQVIKLLITYTSSDCKNKSSNSYSKNFETFNHLKKSDYIERLDITEVGSPFRISWFATIEYTVHLNLKNSDKTPLQFSNLQPTFVKCFLVPSTSIKARMMCICMRISGFWQSPATWCIIVNIHLFTWELLVSKFSNNVPYNPIIFLVPYLQRYRLWLVWSTIIVRQINVSV